MRFRFTVSVTAPDAWATLTRREVESGVPLGRDWCANFLAVALKSAALQNQPAAVGFRPAVDVVEDLAYFAWTENTWERAPVTPLAPVTSESGRGAAQIVFSILLGFLAGAGSTALVWWLHGGLR